MVCQPINPPKRYLVSPVATSASRNWREQMNRTERITCVAEKKEEQTLRRGEGEETPATEVVTEQKEKEAKRCSKTSQTEEPCTTTEEHASRMAKEAAKWRKLRDRGEVDDQRIWLPVTIKEKKYFILYDTGAQVSFIDQALAATLDLHVLPSADTVLTQAGKKLEVLGKTRITLNIPGKVTRVWFLVVEGKAGMGAITEEVGRRLGIYVVGLPAIFSEDENEQIDDEEWLKQADTTKLQEERVTDDELREIMKIIQPAMEANASLPDSTSCNKDFTFDSLDFSISFSPF